MQFSQLFTEVFSQATHKRGLNSTCVKYSRTLHFRPFRNIQLVLSFFKTIKPVSMIFLATVFLYFLLLLIGSSKAAFVDDIVNFLEEQGLQELSEGFVSEEIEVEQLPTIPDDFLVQLGVTTMGARLRLRSSASTWLAQESSKAPGKEQVSAHVHYSFKSVVHALQNEKLPCHFFMLQEEEERLNGGEGEGSGGERPADEGNIGNSTQ